MEVAHHTYKVVMPTIRLSISVPRLYTFRVRVFALVVIAAAGILRIKADVSVMDDAELR